MSFKLTFISPLSGSGMSESDCSCSVRSTARSLELEKPCSSAICSAFLLLLSNSEFFWYCKAFFLEKNPCHFHLVIFILFMLRYITTCRKMSSLFFIYKKYKTTSIIRCLNYEWCYLMNFILKYDVAFKCEFAT